MVFVLKVIKSKRLDVIKHTLRKPRLIAGEAWGVLERTTEQKYFKENLNAQWYTKDSLI